MRAMGTIYLSCIKNTRTNEQTILSAFDDFNLAHKVVKTMGEGDMPEDWEANVLEITFIKTKGEER